MDDTSLSVNTVTEYIAAFNRLFLLRDTRPFSPFARSPIRIKQQAKRRFCDPSLAAALLGFSPRTLMRDVRTFGLLFESLALRDLEIYAEAMEGELYHYQDYKGKIGLVIGSEGFGMSRLVKEECDFIATIPMHGSINSLNASVATGIVIYKALDKRL
mgnify:CR=1 FL=1